MTKVLKMFSQNSQLPSWVKGGALFISFLVVTVLTLLVSGLNSRSQENHETVPKIKRNINEGYRLVTIEVSDASRFALEFASKEVLVDVISREGRDDVKLAARGAKMVDLSRNGSSHIAALIVSESEAVDLVSNGSRREFSVLLTGESQHSQSGVVIVESRVLD